MEAKEDGAAHIMVLLAFGPCIVSHDIFSLQVRLPSGGEVHEFVLPLGYTVDQVKVYLPLSLYFLFTNIISFHRGLSSERSLSYQMTYQRIITLELMYVRY